MQLAAGRLAKFHLGDGVFITGGNRAIAKRKEADMGLGGSHIGQALFHRAASVRRIAFHADHLMAKTPQLLDHGSAVVVQVLRSRRHVNSHKALFGGLKERFSTELPLT